MAEQAKITQIEVLGTFRSSLIVFMTKAKKSLDSANDAVKRMQQWLEVEQRQYWEGQIRRRRKMLEQAEQELFSARLSEFIDTPSLQQQAVRKAQRLVEEAEHKLRKVKTWERDFPTMAIPAVKELDQLSYYIDHDLAKAVAYLHQTQRLLEDYTEKAPPPITVSAGGGGSNSPGDAANAATGKAEGAPPPTESNHP